MKSTTKIMVVAIAVLMAVSMIVAPAAARAPGISDIADGDTIYVWEKDLNLTGLRYPPVTGLDVTKLQYYQDDDTDKAVLNTINVPNDIDFEEILSVDVGTYTGTYRAVNDTGLTGKTVNIEKPALAMDVVLASDHTSSVDGDSISDTDDIAFKLMSKVGNNYMYTNTPGDDVHPAQVKVEYTTPSGGVTTNVGEVDLIDINLTSNQIFTDDIDKPTPLTDAESGAWSAVAKWLKPAGFNDYAPSSNAVTFTVESRTLTVTSEKTEVIRGNNFVTSVSGKANTNYVLYIKEASLEAQDEYPTVMAGQPGVTRGDVLLVTPPLPPAPLSPYVLATDVMGTETPTAGGVNANESFANVKTKADGTRPVEW
ncbi:MAG: hypothetical protein U9N40_00250, partial [Euryarchaeota archaeon]|nr:hypothetical protein [Euryarchaeota archaeon]